MEGDFWGGGMVVGIIVELGIGSAVLDNVKAAAVMAPRFEVEPMWPKPLPNHWLMGNVIGVSVDSKDHIWVIHRGGSLERMETYAAQTPVASECCKPAPSILEFDEEGSLLASWGGTDGPGY